MHQRIYVYDKQERFHYWLDIDLPVANRKSIAIAVREIQKEKNLAKIRSMRFQVGGNWY